MAGYRLITSLEQSWGKELNAWSTQQLVVYSYDNDGHLTQDLWIVPYGGPSYRSVYTYDSAGNLIEHLDQHRSPPDWQNNSLNTFSYDASGNLMEELERYWDNDAGQWENSRTWSYAYDASGRLILIEETDWEDMEGQWKDRFLATLSYNEAGNLIEWLHQGWNAGMWNNETKIVCSYDAGDLLVEEAWQEWGTLSTPDANEWLNLIRYTYSRDANGILMDDVRQEWDLSEGQWENREWHAYSYDAARNLSTVLIQHWSGSWTNLDLHIHSFDAEGNLVESVTQHWDGVHWANWQRELLAWEAITVATDPNVSLPSEFSLSQNYPNPFNPTTTITFDVPRTSDITLSVFDLLGRRVAVLVSGVQAAGTHRVTFDAGGLPSGLYIARLESAAGSFTRQMVLVR